MESSGPEKLDGIVLIRRRDCEPCQLAALWLELLRREAEAVGGPDAGHRLAYRTLDVDESAELETLYGHQVPVILANGQVVCRHPDCSRERLRDVLLPGSTATDGAAAISAAMGGGRRLI